MYLNVVIVAKISFLIQGAIGGGIIGLGVNIWISVCSVLYGTKPLKSPSIGTYGCFLNQTLDVNITGSFTLNRLNSTLGNG